MPLGFVADNLFRYEKFYLSMLSQVIYEQNGSTSIEDLTRMFNRILELVPSHLKLLCDITSGRKNKYVDSVFIHTIKSKKWYDWDRFVNFDAVTFVQVPS